VIYFPIIHNNIVPQKNEIIGFNVTFLNINPVPGTITVIFFELLRH